MTLPSRHMAARGLPLLTGELPTAVPRAFTAYAALKLPVCVPRLTVPRSVIWPFCQRNACELNPVVEYPTTCAASFTSYADVILPPSVPRSVMPYDCGAAARVPPLESIETNMTATMTPTGGRSRRPRTLTMCVPPLKLRAGARGDAQTPYLRSRGRARENARLLFGLANPAYGFSRDLRTPSVGAPGDGYGASVGPLRSRIPPKLACDSARAEADGGESGIRTLSRMAQ